MVTRDLSFPIFGDDNLGFVLYFPTPLRIREGVVNCFGINFEDSPQGFQDLWNMLKASVYHVSAHAAASDFIQYASWTKGKDVNAAKFAITLVEDAIADAYLKMYWPSVLPQIAYVNATSFQCMKPLHRIANSATKAMTATLSEKAVGMSKGNVSSSMRQDAKEIVASLRGLEKSYTRDLPQKIDEFTDSSKLHGNLEKRLNVADFIYWKLIGYGHSSECPSLPYGEKHGMCTVFEDTFYEDLRPTAQNLAQAWHALGLDLPSNVGDLTYRGVQESEACETFDAWLDSERKRQKILSLVLTSATGTRFESVDFPYEDYSEFLRTRRPLSGVIRRVEEEINKIKLLMAENAGEEAGLLDLQAVIQILASKSSNREVFYRERPQTKNEAWAILVDTSLSLKSFGTEVRGIAVCLEEVAKSLIRDPSLWGLYAFDSSFRIVKDFHEIYTNAIRSRVGGLSYRNKTYLPDAIYVASEILRRIVTDSLKVILVVSDFVAFGYDDIEGQLAQASKKTRNDGIDLIGVGVNGTPLKKYFNSFCMIEHPYQMLRYFVQAYMSYAAWA